MDEIPAIDSYIFDSRACSLFAPDAVQFRTERQYLPLAIQPNPPHTLHAKTAAQTPSAAE